MNNKIVCIVNGIVKFHMFILELVCHLDLSLEVIQGLHGGRLNFGVDWQNLCCTIYHGVYDLKNSKNRKKENMCPSYFL